MFWGLTPRELDALVERHKADAERQDFRAAMVCSVMANAWRGKDTRAFTIDDFMPSRQRVRQTPEQMLENVKIINAALGGSVVEV